MRDIAFYKDVFEARNFDDVENMAFLAHVIEVEQKLYFDPYEIQEEFNQALDVYGLKINGVSYAIHPILKTLFIFSPEPIIN